MVVRFEFGKMVVFFGGEGGGLEMKNPIKLRSSSDKAPLAANFESFSPLCLEVSVVFSCIFAFMLSRVWCVVRGKESEKKQRFDDGRREGGRFV